MCTGPLADLDLFAWLTNSETWWSGAPTITGLRLNSSSLWWETPLVKMPTSSRATCIRWCNCGTFVVKWLLIPRASGSDLAALLASQGRRRSSGHKQDLRVQPTSCKAEKRLKMGAGDSDNSRWLRLILAAGVKESHPIYTQNPNCWASGRH